MTATALQIPPWPIITEAERAAVDRVLASGRINAWTGDEVRSFETECAATFGVRHALAVSNGTVALERALEVFDVGVGDDVLVTPRSFLASVSCVVRRGARPVFADVDRDSQVLTVETLDAARTPSTRAVIVVHLAGWPCDMPAIMAWAETHGIKVIEDAAQAHGATVDGMPVGGMGHIACFSFCQDKIITTGGEGGLLTTNDDGAARRIWMLRDHGRDPERVASTDHPPGFRWLQGCFGTNDRMTEMQAAIGRIQLADLPNRIEARSRNARMLHDAISTFEWIRSPWPSDRFGHAWYRYHCFVDAGVDRDAVMRRCNEAGVPCYTGGCPEIYREQPFVESQLAPDVRLHAAQELGETSLQFLVHHTIDEATMQRVVDVLTYVLSEF